MIRLWVFSANKVEADTLLGKIDVPVDVEAAKGEYFGEIALLTDRRRACTVKAVGPTKVLSLQRKTFTRVMGPLQELLKRNMGAYNSYMLS